MPGHRPRDVGQKPLAGAHILEVLAADLRPSLDIDEALLKLKRPLIGEVQARHLDKLLFRMQIKAGMVCQSGGNDRTFHQAIAIMSAKTVNRVSGIPNFEHWPFARPRRHDRTMPRATRNKSFAGEALQGLVYRHTRC